MPRQVQVEKEAEAQPQASSVWGCCLRAPWRRAQGARDKAASKATMRAWEGHRAASFQENNGFPPKRGESRTFGGLEHDISFVVPGTPSKAENGGEGEQVLGRAPVVTGCVGRGCSTAVCLG